MGQITKPTHDAIAELMEQLLGKPTTVSDADGPADHQQIGVFVFDDDSPAYLCSGDWPCVAFLGGALSMVPPGAAQEQAESGDVGAMTVENFYEVLNISSSLFNLAGSDHVRLLTMHTPAELPDVATGLFSAGATWTVDLDVQGYGVGRMSFFHA